MLEKLGRVDEAVDDVLRFPGVQPSATLVPRLVERLRRADGLPTAIATLEEATSRGGTPRLWAALAECQAESGDLTAACQSYQEAIRLDPGNLTVRTALGRVSGRQSILPFELVDGQVKPVPIEVSALSLEEAVGQLSYVLNTSASRVWAAYWLGRILESHGRIADAGAAYETAVSRAKEVDKPWAHNAEQAWRFRRSYVESDLKGQSPTDDSRLARKVQLGPRKDEFSEVGGFFEASITNNGLFIEGFMINSYRGSVEVCLDSMPLMTVAGDPSRWNRDFKTTIVHGVLGEFPTTSELTLKVGEVPLVTIGGARSVTLVVPDGSGEITSALAVGRKITKKGRWADVVARGREDVYLSAYTSAKEFFDEKLGVKLFLSYGTLLGCYRDGGPIPGDDDFDVSFVSEATEPHELKNDGIRIIKSLLRGGFDARVAVDGRMFHLRVGDVTLDINPFWFHAGRAWSFDAHQLERDVFEPVVTMLVGGVEVYIPAKTEEFLCENYGPDWRIPRADFHYHRAKADQATLRKARLVPSEVRELKLYSESLRAVDPSCGRFHGYGDPGRPGFD